MSYKLAGVIWNDDGTMATDELTPLEALERLRNTLLAEGYWQDVLQDVAIIEKSLKAFEFIKKQRMLSVFKDINGTCFLVFNGTGVEITKDEYELLKEILL